MRAPRTIALALVLALAPAACRRGAGDAWPRIAPREASVLRVTNHNWLDVTVYVHHDGLASRVGTVTAATTRTFLLPRRLLGADGRIVLLADPVGSAGRVSSDVLFVQPGQGIEWTLESGLERSSAGLMP